MLGKTASTVAVPEINPVELNEAPVGSVPLTHE